MKIFIVKIDYSTENCHDTELLAFNDYYKAYDKFKELIQNEHQPENSWVANLDFDEDGEPIGHYELDFEDNNTCESELWWHIEDLWDSKYYTYVKQSSVGKPYRKKIFITPKSHYIPPPFLPIIEGGDPASDRIFVETSPRSDSRWVTTLTCSLF